MTRYDKLAVHLESVDDIDTVSSGSISPDLGEMWRQGCPKSPGLQWFLCRIVGFSSGKKKKWWIRARARVAQPDIWLQADFQVWSWSLRANLFTSSCWYELRRVALSQNSGTLRCATCVLRHATNWRYVWPKKTGRWREAGGTVSCQLMVSRVLQSPISASCTDHFGLSHIWNLGTFPLWCPLTPTCWTPRRITLQWKIEDNTTLWRGWYNWVVDCMSLGVFCHILLRRARAILVVAHLWSEKNTPSPCCPWCPAAGVTADTTQHLGTTKDGHHPRTKTGPRKVAILDGASGLLAVIQARMNADTATGSTAKHRIRQRTSKEPLWKRMDDCTTAYPSTCDDIRLHVDTTSVRVSS